RMVHHRERLPLVVKASQHLRGIHARLHDLEGHVPTNGLELLGEVDTAHPSFAQWPKDVIAPEVVIARRESADRDWRCDRFVCANHAVESAHDQTLRTQSGGATGTQLLSALRAVRHSTRARRQLA